jgi:4-hydroxybutyryl-CoA dehydratase/vinylacetyl-CoA-Delta-isomerase
MTMKTGQQYRESIRDDRASFLDGKRVPDATTDPLLAVSVDWIARTYDRHYSSDPAARNPMFDQPETAVDLQEQMDFLLAADSTAATTAGCMALRDVAPRLGAVRPEYQQRLERFLARCRDEDLRVAAATDDAGSLKVVSRTAEGVVLKGAKRHVIAASLVHELVVVPASAVKAGDADSAIACAVPVNTPGVKVVNITTAPRAEDDRHYPVSRERSIPDCLVLFDDVFVPNDRIFLNGEVEQSGALADALGIWDRARSAAALADEAELLLGMAQTIAEMNGVPDPAHIRDKLSSLAVWATMCRAGWEAALAHAATTATGMVVPSETYIYAMKSYGGTLYTEMTGYLHDISGALVLTCPTVADYDNEATHMYMEKYLRTMDGVTGEDRMKIFHLVRDMTADQYGGWAKVTNQMVGGGLYAQRMASLRNHDLVSAKARARAATVHEGS